MISFMPETSIAYFVTDRDMQKELPDIYGELYAARKLFTEAGNAGVVMAVCAMEARIAAAWKELQNSADYHTEGIGLFVPDAPDEQYLAAIGASYKNALEEKKFRDVQEAVRKELEELLKAL